MIKFACDFSHYFQANPSIFFNFPKCWTDWVCDGSISQRCTSLANWAKTSTIPKKWSRTCWIGHWPANTWTYWRLLWSVARCQRLSASVIIHREHWKISWIRTIIQWIYQHKRVAPPNRQWPQKWLAILVQNYYDVPKHVIQFTLLF